MKIINNSAVYKTSLDLMPTGVCFSYTNGSHIYLRLVCSGVVKKFIRLADSQLIEIQAMPKGPIQIYGNVELHIGD